jgi:acyl carrier protein
MTAEEIKKAVFKVLGTIAPEADLGSLSATENLRQALDIDSFDFLNVVIGISKELGVEVPESDYGKISTLEDMVGYLSRRKG